MSSKLFLITSVTLMIYFIQLSYQIQDKNFSPAPIHKYKCPLPGHCNQTELTNRCKDQVCALEEEGHFRYIKSNCTYAEYKAEYCECCKHCPYPPPKIGVSGCPKKPVQPIPIVCADFIYEKCTAEMYIEEICEECKHCPGYTVTAPNFG